MFADGRLSFVRIITSLGFISLWISVALPAQADIEQDLNEAERLVRQGRFADALPLLQTVLAQHPALQQDHRAHFWRAVAEDGLGHPDQAIADWEHLVQANSNYRWAQTYSKLAVRYRAKYDIIRSDYYVQRLIDRRRGDADPGERQRADLLIGDALKLKGDWVAAVAHYQDIRSLYPDQDQDILFHIANAAHSGKNYALALESYMAYARLYASNDRFREVALYKMVEVYRDAKRAPEAIVYLDALLADHPQWRAPILLWKSELYAESLQNVPLSMSCAQQVIDESADAYQVYVAKYRQATNHLFCLKDWQSARTILQALVQENPIDHLAVEIAANLAETYNQEGDHLQAAEAYARSLQDHPCPVPQWDAYIRFMVGDSYRQAGRLVEAIQAWRDVITRHSGTEWAVSAQKEISKWSR